MIVFGIRTLIYTWLRLHDSECVSTSGSLNKVGFWYTFEISSGNLAYSHDQ